MYYQTKFDDVILIGFWVIPKITSAHLCKPIHDINYSTFSSPFESGEFGQEGKKLQKFYLENEKSFLDGMKSFFYSFWRATIWWKIKNRGYKLYFRYFLYSLLNGIVK